MNCLTPHCEKKGFGQSWWKEKKKTLKISSALLPNMIYSQTLGAVINYECSFSTVCVGMPLSLPCTSDDFKRDNKASSEQLQRVTTEGKLLCHPLALCLRCVFHLVCGGTVSPHRAVGSVRPVTLCVSWCVSITPCSHREGHIFSYISCFGEDACRLRVGHGCHVRE